MLAVVEHTPAFRTVQFDPFGPMNSTAICPDALPVTRWIKSVTVAFPTMPRI
jgi:hypothetical protein